MASNINNTTPASPAGSKNLQWQLDTGGNISANYVAPFDVSAFNPGIGVNGQMLGRAQMTRPVTFPASAPNSKAEADVAATGSTTFTLKKNGTSFATIVFSASGTTGAFTQASDATFAAGDLLEIDGPATADATLADISINLFGYLT